MMFAYILAVASVLVSSNAYPTGAPQGACYDMIPGHGHDVQTSPPPYTITTPVTAVRAGDSVEVIIKGKTPQDTMRGILLQARQGDKIVGKWTVEPNNPFAQLMDCGEPGNAVTHISHPPELDQTSISYRWTAPKDLEGDVKFLVTIVKSFAVYWVRIESAPVKILSHH